MTAEEEEHWKKMNDWFARGFANHVAPRDERLVEAVGKYLGNHVAAIIALGQCLITLVDELGLKDDARRNVFDVLTAVDRLINSDDPNDEMDPNAIPEGFTRTDRDARTYLERERTLLLRAQLSQQQQPRPTLEW